MHQSEHFLYILFTNKHWTVQLFKSVPVRILGSSCWHDIDLRTMQSFLSDSPTPIWKWMLQRTVFERIALLTGQCPIWRRDAPSWMQQKDWHSSWSLAHLVRWVDCFVTIRLGTLKAKFLRTECTSFLISIYLVFVVAILCRQKQPKKRK